MSKKEIKPAGELIKDLLREKSSIKQDVVEKTDIAFKSFKLQAAEIAKSLQAEVTPLDKRLKFEHTDKSALLFNLRFAGDTLIFYRHTNVFQFEKSHPLWKTSYFHDDEMRSYCGIINIFNFLTDSLLYNRQGDRGYLVARVFINKDGHYFVEGKRQLSYLYNDFASQVFDDKAATSIIESAILYSLDFDLYTPPYDSIKEVGVSDILEQAANINMSTAKRMGFRFQSDDETMM
ncbi:MAG: hypothetical protein M0D57_20905 [Sphingobacteriales bacterium JAD_PAG50586_3]|nr:MAG: hypothetical protein M0D57_20905 [Sphingobacteriales bacterium JAD_PAG50586_3]